MKSESSILVSKVTFKFDNQYRGATLPLAVALARIQMSGVGLGESLAAPGPGRP